MTVVCLMGPTASGKTEVAVELAASGNFEIISVDSAQIYTQMDIGTAKPDAQTLAVAPHHLIDFVDPKDSYSVAQFYNDASTLIKTIQGRGKTPLLVGGTMMYFNALQKGLSKLPESDSGTRKALLARMETEGLAALYHTLEAKDPAMAARLHPHDQQRIVRALEVYMQTGTTMSQLQQEAITPAPFTFVSLALWPEDRAVLHQRIAKRFAHMLAQGLVEEVEALYQRGDLHVDLPSIRSVGYRQVWTYLQGECDYETMQERGVIATRQLAKRQLTWLRSWPDLHRIHDANSAQECLKLLGK